MLDLNTSWRGLLEKPSTPLSVWAKVLERANHLSENETDSDVRAERRASAILWFAPGASFCGSFTEQLRTAIYIVPNVVPMREISVL
jgi:hypothetical protein